MAAEHALDAPEWLRVFSHRLDVDTGGSRPWVRYQ
jgi:hypothetical protein